MSCECVVVTRVCVVTGSASGIGAATADALRAAGAEVVGVDVAGADVSADLTTAEGRAEMVSSVRRVTGGRVDAVVANAGTIGRGPGDVRLNFFGAVATLEGLRPLLAAGEEPKAVAMCSVALVGEVAPDLVEACLAGDEDAAMALASDPAAPLDPVVVYASTKRALARWVRAHAPTPDWAGAGIALNAVAPGVVRTPMTEPILADERGRALLEAATPMPYGGIAEPAAVARVVAFLADASTRGVTGQVVFVDGGADCVLRGDGVWA